MPVFMRDYFTGPCMHGRWPCLITADGKQYTCISTQNFTGLCNPSFGLMPSSNACTQCVLPLPALTGYKVLWEEGGDAPHSQPAYVTWHVFIVYMCKLCLICVYRCKLFEGGDRKGRGGGERLVGTEWLHARLASHLKTKPGQQLTGQSTDL